LELGADAQLFVKVALLRAGWTWYQAWAQEWWRDKLERERAGQWLILGIISFHLIHVTFYFVASWLPDTILRCVIPVVLSK